MIMRRLVTASSETVNTHPIVTFKYTRFKFDTNSHGELQLELVPTSSVQYPSFIFVDSTVLVKYIIIHSTNVNQLQTDEHRQKIKILQHPESPANVVQGISASTR